MRVVVADQHIARSRAAGAWRRRSPAQSGQVLMLPMNWAYQRFTHRWPNPVLHASGARRFGAGRPPRSSRTCRSPPRLPVPGTGPRYSSVARAVQQLARACASGRSCARARRRGMRSCSDRSACSSPTMLVFATSPAVPSRLMAPARQGEPVVEGDHAAWGRRSSTWPRPLQLDAGMPIGAVEAETALGFQLGEG